MYRKLILHRGGRNVFGDSLKNKKTVKLDGDNVLDDKVNSGANGFFIRLKGYSNADRERM